MKAQDLFQDVTNKIIEQIEAGDLPVWQKCWNGYGAFPLRHDESDYSGGNILMLWIASMAKGYTQPIWMTFKQAEKIGAKVKKGEKGTHVYYYDHGVKENAETGEKTSFAFAKCYSVFNVEQIDGLPEKYIKPVKNIKNPDEKDVGIFNMILASGAKFQHNKGMGNYYSPKADVINLEHFEDFHSAHDYYATAFHELVHWTGAESRLNRGLVTKKYTSEYAFEELVDELGSAFLCAKLGISSEPRKDHAVYLASWLKAFKDDKQFLFKAASQASKAVDFILNNTKQEELAA